MPYASDECLDYETNFIFVHASTSKDHDLQELCVDSDAAIILEADSSSLIVTEFDREGAIFPPIPFCDVFRCFSTTNVVVDDDNADLLTFEVKNEKEGRDKAPNHKLVFTCPEGTAEEICQALQRCIGKQKQHGIREGEKQAKRKGGKVKKKGKSKARNYTGPAILLLGIIGLVVSLLFPHLLGLGGDKTDCPWLEGNPDRNFTEDAKAVAAAHSNFLQANLDALKNAPAIDRSSADPTKPFTEDELAKFSGLDSSKPLLVAVGGFVFDVTPAKAFYGTNGPYLAFAGRACTRGVTLPSLQDADISDETDDFTPAQHQKRQDWIDFFLKKYVQVGTLIPDSKDASKARRERLKQKKLAKKEQQQVATQQKMHQQGELYSEEQLKEFDGSDETKPIMFAIAGHVLDVSASKKFYGAGAPRHMYAGRAISRAITLQSTKPEDLNDDIGDFDDEQRALLKKRLDFFLTKFPKAGTLKTKHNFSVLVGD